eukprot:jgi/Picre1/34411/NNA_001880.t1
MTPKSRCTRNSLVSYHSNRHEIVIWEKNQAIQHSQQTGMEDPDNSMCSNIRLGLLYCATDQPARLLP